MEREPTIEPWIRCLSDDDLLFLKRFVLASGSLKSLGKTYGLSYPTIRQRMNRLIETVLILDEQKFVSPFEKLLLGQFAKGKLDEPTMRSLLAAHERELSRGD